MKRDTAIAALAAHGGDIRQAALSVGIARYTLKLWRYMPASNGKANPGPGAGAVRIYAWPPFENFTPRLALAAFMHRSSSQPAHVAL